MSMGSPILDSGMMPSRAFLMWGSAYIFSVMGVCVMPGDTTFTRIPSGAHSNASVWASIVSAALLGLYAPDPACGSWPDIDEVKHAERRQRLKWVLLALARSHVPRRLTENISSQVSMDRSHTAFELESPAFTINGSRPPN